MLTSSPNPSPLLPLSFVPLFQDLRDKTVLLVETVTSGIHEALEMSEFGADARVIRATSIGALDLLETEGVDAAIVNYRTGDIAGTAL